MSDINFNIETKKVLKTVETNTDTILSICELNDGRIATSTFGEVVIYNINEDKKDMTINENIEEVKHLFLMNSGYLFSSACEECIIYDIKPDKYEIIQKLGDLYGDTPKSIELKNGDIISLSRGFYVFQKEPDQNKYSKIRNEDNSEFFYDIIQISSDKVIISSEDELKIWDINKWSVITVIKDIYVGCFNGCLYQIDSNNLIVGGKNCIYLIDLNDYKVKKKIDTDYETFCVCPINENIFLTTGTGGTITQWKFDGNDITKEYEKENVISEDSEVCLCMKYLKNGTLVLGDNRNLVILG